MGQDTTTTATARTTYLERRHLKQERLRMRRGLGHGPRAARTATAH